MRVIVELGSSHPSRSLIKSFDSRLLDGERARRFVISISRAFIRLKAVDSRARWNPPEIIIQITLDQPFNGWAINMLFKRCSFDLISEFDALNPS